MEEKRKRNPNFSLQDSLLLTQIMGETHPDFHDMDMSFHKVDKARFSNRISKATKNALWVAVTENVNARAQFRREQSILEKKWENLQRDHRNLYMDFQREISLTGRGPIGRTLSVLTEAVIDVIGKQSAAVVGAAGAAYDSTLASLMLPQQFDLCDSEERSSVSDGPIFNVMDLVPVKPSQRVQSCSTTTSTLPSPNQAHCCCCSDSEMRALKKRKLELQIKFYER
ncbi:uncharacterized protein LOC127861983 isoform X1 [Dreissena polymorpha]|uniref:uncharacterized protein LOC127861983 isoform X1 n=1 Tax=Dreissena polymorpha TaxID=45954 RepID=UPI002264DA0D|nr:uncharacterized protein LOC127861983 isoform X1 [Dreissena polymorpha]